MTHQLQIDWRTAATVVTAVVGIYLAFVLLLRISGPRTLTITSSFDFACVVAFGAILGRTVLMFEPTLAIGCVALATFVALQRLTGSLRHSPRFARLLSGPPRLLVADGQLMQENLRSARIVEDELRQAVRSAGLGSLSEVRYLVLEPSGNLSVIGAEHPADPWLLADVATRSGPAS